MLHLSIRDTGFIFLFCQFALVEVMVTSLMDGFSQPLITLFKRKELFVLAVCGVAFLLGIPCVMQVQNSAPLDDVSPNHNQTVGTSVSYLLC